MTPVETSEQGMKTNDSVLSPKAAHATTASKQTSIASSSGAARGFDRGAPNPTIGISSTGTAGTNGGIMGVKGFQAPGRGSQEKSDWRKKVRTFLRGRTALVLMLIALALALYVPDVIVTVGLTGNLVNDVLLSIVMSMFLSELILLSLVDSSYPLSFFFWMDTIGTISMVTDISYMLGSKADEPQPLQQSDRDLTFFRATRTAKIASRAGRLSRLVKVMKFLPGSGRKNDQKGEAEKLQQISNQLTNVLSKRVACLTILLVIFMPLFTIGLYPESDFSMQVWVESLSRRLGESAQFQQSDLDSYINQFASFYAGKAYGPYQVCLSNLPGSLSDALAGCTQFASPDFDRPQRRSFQLDVSATMVVASFDFSTPVRTEANMGILLISLVVVLMCGACLLLNYAASELAVRPLERMLTSIKGSAKAIFSSVSALGPEENDEDFGEHMDSEVALLERVVRKIATLAELSSKKNLFDEEAMKGMKSEELGVLAMTATHQTHTRHATATESSEDMGGAPSGMGGVTVTMQWQLEEIGLDYEILNSWDFDVLTLSVQKLEQISAWLIMNNPGSCAFTEQNVEIKKMRAFVNQIGEGYMDNQYHCFMHGVDVTHCVFRYMTLAQAELLFSQVEQFAVLVASVSHDLGHIGLNNAFLIEVQHDLAIRYNDRSPLENLHCCQLFEVLGRPAVNVFSGMKPEQYRDVRKLIIEMILHTDITQHPAMVKELELLYEMNSKVFEANTTGQLADQEIEVLTTAPNKKLIANLLLHSADTSNPTKPWDIAKSWAWRVLDEYAAQGDQEKKLGIPVQMLNDRDKVNRPNSQIGFIEFIITPLVAAEVKLFPAWVEKSQLLEENLRGWQELWIEECQPGEAEKEKVRERVNNMSAKLLVTDSAGLRPRNSRRLGSR
jgi:hypothetical protein